MKRPQLEDLTLREKVGQTVCVRENLLTDIPNLFEHLKKYPHGCIWAMGNQLNDTENMGEETNKSGKATGKVLEARGIQVDYMYPMELDKWAYAKTMTDMNQYDLVLAACYLRGHRPVGIPGYNYYHQRFLQFLQTYANNKVIGVAYGAPNIYFNYFTNTGKAFIAAYDYTLELQEAVVKALFGEIPFQGKCPFQLIPDYFLNNPFT